MECHLICEWNESFHTWATRIGLPESYLSKRADLGMTKSNHLSRSELLWKMPVCLCEHRGPLLLLSSAHRTRRRHINLCRLTAGYWCAYYQNYKFKSTTSARDALPWEYCRKRKIGNARTYAPYHHLSKSFWYFMALINKTQTLVVDHCSLLGDFPPSVLAYRCGYY